MLVNCELDAEFNVTNLKQEIHPLQTRKSPGVDGISQRLLMGENDLVLELLHLFNTYRHCRMIPELCDAITVTLQKQG